MFDRIDRLTPRKVRTSHAWLRTTELVAIALTDDDGEMREGLELALYTALILAAALWIVSRLPLSPS